MLETIFWFETINQLAICGCKRPNYSNITVSAWKGIALYRQENISLVDNTSGNVPFFRTKNLFFKDSDSLAFCGHCVNLCASSSVTDISPWTGVIFNPLLVQKFSAI